METIRLSARFLTLVGRNMTFSQPISLSTEKLVQGIA